MVVRQAEPLPDRRVVRDHLHVRVVGETVHGLLREAERDVGGPGPCLEQQCGVGSDPVDHDLRRLRGREEPGRRGEHGLLIRLIRLQRERADAGDVTGHPRVDLSLLDAAVGVDYALVDDRRCGLRPVLKDVCVGHAQVDDQGRRVRRRNRLDQRRRVDAVVDEVPAAAAHRDRALEGVLHGLRVDRLAARELHAGLKLEGVRLAAVRDLPRLREVRNDVARVHLRRPLRAGLRPIPREAHVDVLHHREVGEAAGFGRIERGRRDGHVQYEPRRGGSTRLGPHAPARVHRQAADQGDGGAERECERGAQPPAARSDSTSVGAHSSSLWNGQTMQPRGATVSHPTPCGQACA